MRLTEVCYRAHNPQWAWAPLSGDGAASKGGRFNPKGTPALYLALTLEGLVFEMGHGFSRVFEPLTVCTYHLDVSDVVDLRTDELRSAAGVEYRDMACAWEYDLSQGNQPASWKIHAKLASAGAAGIVVPSFARGVRADMQNVVLWTWGPRPPHKVEVYDPSGRLPRDQLSWS